ncbi:hypothetical protein TMAG_03583, partial [Mycobacterium tuberculosis SUMu001]
QQEGVLDLKTLSTIRIGISVHIDPVQRAARRGRHPTVGRSGRKLL